MRALVLLRSFLRVAFAVLFTCLQTIMATGKSTIRTKSDTQKCLKSIPAPLDDDSDSDFSPGAYVYEKPKRGRGRLTESSPKGSRTNPKKRSRRSDVLDRIGAGVPKKKAKRSHGTVSGNPLLEFFDESLGLDLAALDDEENQAGDEKMLEDEEDEEEEEDEEQEVEYDSENAPGRPSSPARPLQPSRNRQPAPQPHSDAGVNADDSVTEPESDGDLPPPLPPKQPGTKKAEAVDGSATETESETEPESDDEMVSLGPSNVRQVGQGKKVSGAINHDGTESETEPESECEEASQIVMFSIIYGYHSDSHVSNRQLRSGTQSSFISSAIDDPKDALVLDLKLHITVPPSLNKHLREYQREGVRFFFERYAQNRGAVLGDDMGLGKTIQVISFLSALMRKSGTKADVDRRRKYVSKLQDGMDWKQHRKLPPPDAKWPTALIVVPSSVVGVWAREFVKWGYFEVGLYIGPRGEREDVLNDFKMGRLDVVVTSFETARRSIALLDSLPWTVLIIDEAHRLKNPRSKSTLAFSSFAWPEDHPMPPHISQLTEAQAPSSGTSAQTRTGPIRFALTGTAIQNSYLELWTLLDWANPGSVGTISQWKKCVMDPLMAGQAKGSKEEERIRATAVAQRLRDKLLPKFFLRRTKDIIKDQLPKKTDEIVFCPLTPKQIEKNDVIVDPERKCCHKFKAGDLFKYMSTLIKISNHLALILPAPTDTPDQTLRNRELCKIAFPDDNVPKYGPAMLLPRFCGKWMVLETLLREWRKDPSNKVLIFTKSVKLLEMLEFHLDRQNYGFVKLDGSTKQSDRMPIIDKFHADPDVFIFLISTLAGGTGLNLTGANKVVVFDPNWNPAHDLQAMDRAYRFGQTRDVSVYRLLGAGSIEELIYARQVYKQQQMAIGYEASVQTRYFSGVSGDKSRQGELFGLQNIFKLHENTSTTKVAIERANMVNLDWALAHMDAIKAKKPRKKNGAAEDWVYEAEAKETKEDEELKGLGALLLDDTVPELNENDVSSILNDHGIKYSHRNDDILAPSHIEEARIKTVIKEKRQQAKRAKEQKETADKPPKPDWPPKRKHHKEPPSSRSK
ncbi:hypothetical protein EWM64_g7051 [Hericium alpestre]|uniref:Helicase C-terminal domain-containing protein n=1 Tax=Hericium alpestre TaxID=135208 RepID=A0A4Y9ZT15_9AGAM|nr:hypothetical protein EWM64_g7051 [Hericium alpestre]